MPTKNPKTYHILWKETIFYSAAVQTNWTPDEIVAHDLSTPEDEEALPVWQKLLEEQIVDPSESVVEREIEFMDAVEASPVDTRAESLTADARVELIDNIRDLVARKWEKDEFYEAVNETFKAFGLAPYEPGEWGVRDRWGRWAIYQVTEEAAWAYWEKHDGTWQLCSSITPDKGGDHFVVMEEREGNAPPSSV
jgi:hypothetical protein